MTGSSFDKWTTAEETKLAKFYMMGTPLSEIEKALGRSVKTISNKAKRMHLVHGSGIYEAKKPSSDDTDDTDDDVLKQVVVDDLTDGEIFDAWVATIYESSPDDYHPITPCDYCDTKLEETFWGRGRHCFCSEDCAIASVAMMESCSIYGLCPTCLG